MCSHSEGRLRFRVMFEIASKKELSWPQSPKWLDVQNISQSFEHIAKGRRWKTAGDSLLKNCHLWKSMTDARNQSCMKEWEEWDDGISITVFSPFQLLPVSVICVFIIQILDSPIQTWLNDVPSTDHIEIYYMYVYYIVMYTTIYIYLIF